MRALLLFVVLGAASLITQALSAREMLAAVHGSELSIGIFLACWLAWIGVGAALGTRLAPRLQRPRHALFIASVAGATLPVLQMAAMRHGPALLQVAPGLVVSWQQGALLALATLAPWGLFIGITFPMGARVIGARSGAAIGRLYAAESAGAVVGGLVLSYLLLGRVQLFAIAAGAGALILAAATLALAGTPGGDDALPRRTVVLGGLLAASLAISLPFFARLDGVSLALAVGAVSPGQRLVTVFDTPYERVAITELAGQYTVYGDGLPAATFPDPYAERETALRLLVQKPDAARVLVVGNAASGLAQELWRLGSAEITFVQADARLLAAITALLPAEDLRLLEDHARAVIADPRAFLRTATERYDLVFIDLPAPTAAHINRFYTREAFVAARGALAPAGVLAFRLAPASAYTGPEVGELVMSVRAALASVFEETLLAPGDDGFVFASLKPGVLAKDPEAVRSRLANIPQAQAFGDAIALDYRPERLARHEELLRAFGDTPANTDDLPASAYLGAVLWDRFSSSARQGFSLLPRLLRGVREIATAGFALALVVCAGVWLAVRRLLRARALATAKLDASAVVCVLGAASMATSIVLLIQYQSACGALFERLAAMSALYMLGLTMGTGATGQVRARATPRRGLPALLACAALFSVSLPLLLASALELSPLLRELVFGTLFVLTGALYGAGLPLAAQLVAATGSTRFVAATAGLIDAADHAGAALGALLTGTLILPALGARATLRLIAWSAVLSAGCLLLRPRLPASSNAARCTDRQCRSAAPSDEPLDPAIPRLELGRRSGRGRAEWAGT